MYATLSAAISRHRYRYSVTVAAGSPFEYLRDDLHDLFSLKHGVSLSRALDVGRQYSLVFLRNGGTATNNDGNNNANNASGCEHKNRGLPRQKRAPFPCSANRAVYFGDAVYRDNDGVPSRSDRTKTNTAVQPRTYTTTAVELHKTRVS